MDPTALIAFLAPCLALLERAGTSTAERGGAALADGLWEHARRLWARLRPAVQDRPAAEEAVHDLAERPDDERARAVLVWQLQKALEADPTLTADLGRLWGAACQAGAVAGAGGVAVGGSISASTVVVGDHNRLGPQP